MIFLNQAVSLALIYTYRASDEICTMISSEKVVKYEKIVNENLKEMKSEIRLTPDYQVHIDDLFFFYTNDENYNGYYVLKDDKESINIRENYIKNLPLDIVIASQNENALSALDLELDNGYIRRKTNKKIKQLV